MGYCPNTKGYRCYDPCANKVYTSRHVKFVETEFPYSELINTTGLSSDTSSQFHVPLTKFDDLSVPASVPITTVIPSTPNSCLHPSTENVTTDVFSSDVPSPVFTSQPVQSSDLNHSSPSVSDISSPHPDEVFVPILPHPSSPSSVVPPTSDQSISPSVAPPPVLPHHSMTTRSQNGIVKPKKFYGMTVVGNQISLPEKEPTHFSEATKHQVWQQAMNTEYLALLKQDTWSLVPPPSGANVIGCQWIYKIKRNSDGSVARYKARLVANGKQQAEGIDFTETFSPVIKQPTVRVVLSLAVHYAWSIQQLDVTNAFLHGVIDEEVYMKQPLGYKDPAHPNFVCKLNKALYGLRQAPRAWFSMFSGFLLQQGFIHSKADASLFTKKTEKGVTLVLVYVDDILATGSDKMYISELIQVLGQKFVMKDLGSLSYFLGIEVLNHGSSLILSQTKYATDLLSKAGMQDCKPSPSPSSSKPAVFYPDPEFLDPHWFRTVVGSLQYLTLTKPEISFAVNLACQHMHKPHYSHFVAVKRILRYIKGSLQEGLHFVPSPLQLTAFSDADWAGDHLDRRSTSGYCLYLGSNLVSWCAKKQHTVARSSTEAEYRALAQAAADISWVQQLLVELYVPLALPHVVWCDNISAVALASNPIFHAWTKHVEVDYHFIREKVLSKQIQVQHVGTLEQIANIFTKSLSVARFLFLKAKFRVFPTPMSLQGAVKQGH